MPMTVMWLLVMASLTLWVVCSSSTDGPSTGRLSSALAESDRSIVLLITRLGLSNRLRAMADWYLIAKHSNRKLIVTWSSTSDCAIQFSGLFASHPSDMEVIDAPIPVGHEGRAMVLDAVNATNKTAQLVKLDVPGVYWHGSSSFVLDPAFLQIPAQVIVTDYVALVTMHGLPCQYYLSKRSAFLSSLVPLPSLQQTVDHLMSQYFGTHLPIAVHIRYHDKQYDWAIVPPAGGHMATEFGEKVSVQDFFNLMRRIQKHFTINDGKAERSLARFLIVSNNQTIKKQVLAEFGNSAVALEGGDLSRSTESGMQFAFVEWLAISRCELVLNTWKSTFATEAAAVRGKPIVGIWEGHPIHHDAAHLPYCANIGYLMMYGQEHAFFSFVEGSVDNRQIAGKTFELQVTNSLQHLGLPDVFYPASSSRE